MTENDVNETSQIESLEPSPGGPITDGLTVNEDEPSLRIRPTGSWIWDELGRLCCLHL